jgi:enoyl-CoA hydratase/carnithine racemase
MQDSIVAVRLGGREDDLRRTLNRPDNGNALDLSMGQALVAAATRCDQDDSVRCVVLTGAGRMFCAGGDVGLIASAGEDLPTLIHESARSLHMAMARFARMAKPPVVLVNGPTAGAGRPGDRRRYRARCALDPFHGGRKRHRTILASQRSAASSSC